VASSKQHPRDVVRVVLRPCKIWQDRVVPTDSPDVEFSWRALLAKFAPIPSKNASLAMRSLQQGSYVGLVRREGEVRPSFFVFMNADRSNRLGTGLIKDTDFPNRVVEVYRVEKADWGTSVVELGVAVER
jgi:hypothetical protein